MKIKSPAMKINISRLIENIKGSSVYMPVIEAIVNSIDSIDSAKINNGEIIVTFERDKQEEMCLDTETCSPVSTVIIEDNGVGFDENNRESFNTVYSDYKSSIGGKGFGRFTFLKFFTKAKIESIYKSDNKFISRNFEFVKDNNIIENEQVSESNVKKTGTKVILEDIKLVYKSGFNKHLDTIARKIMEQLLVFFVLDEYSCPKIILQDEKEKIILNDYLVGKNEIVEMNNNDFELVSDNKKEQFKIKIFKVYYSGTKSSINLVANKRQVTNEMLYQYIPEFKDDFYDYVDGIKKEQIKKGYSIKSYVMAKYLDENVSAERNSFNFSKDSDLFYPFSQRDIEKKSAEITKNVFGSEIKPRRAEKEKRIRNYIDNKAPWYKIYINELDFSSLPFDIQDEEIETELQKIRLRKEKTARDKINEIINDVEIKKEEKINQLVSEITDAGKSDLLHYIATRKVVLDLFKKSLEINDKGKYELESVVHDIIFPIKSDNSETSYDNHNLWIIDERLSFNEFLSSDKPLGNGSKDRPDILIFDKAISVREGNDNSNPITVFEFKRPQREEYDFTDDPINQIGKYIEQIRGGKYKSQNGRQIIANDSTPAYGFLICDFTKKIIDICSKTHDLSIGPDGQSFFGFKKSFNFYIEVISFDKLLKDAELRNKIFFKKANI